VPEIVRAGVLVEFEEMTTPELIVTVNADDPFQPAVIAPACRQRLVWLAEIVYVKAFALP
jgi:hypothetical protein